MTAGWSVPSRIVLVLCGALLVPSPGGAQDERGNNEVTRTAEAETRRREKAAALEPYAPVAAEAVLLYVEDTRLLGRLFNPVEGWFGQVGGLSEGAGFAAGGGYRAHAGPAGTFDARGIGSWQRAFLADVTWRSQPLASDRVAFSAQAAVERHAGQHFYGLGPQATRRYDSDYDLDERRLAAEVGVQVARWLTVGAGGGYRTLSLHHMSFDFDDEDDHLDPDRDDDDPQVQQYLNGWIPGLETRPALASLQVAATIDTRPSLAGGGSRLAVRHGWHHDTREARHSFAATRIEAQQFIPFWSGTRMIVLSAAADRLRAADGHSVPFYLQPTLGGGRRLRGFERHRFRDTSALLLQAEYQYDINQFVAGALFAETGQVASDWRRLRARGFRGDYGLGLRLGYGGAVAVRSDLAFGGEGPRLVIALSGVF